MDKIKSIGSLEAGKKCIEQAIEKVPAYRKFLDATGKTGKEDFHELPLTTKDNYLRQHPLQDVASMPVPDCMVIFSSSGSSNHKPFYWIYEKRTLLGKDEAIIKQMFSLDKKKTLIIIALSLGSWAGGDSFSAEFKLMSLKANYPLSVLAIGLNIDEVISTVNNFEKYYEQILVITGPTIFSHIMLVADHEKKTLPYEKMRYIMIEEGFTENFRISLQQKAKVQETEPIAYSMLGAADCGHLGMESIATIALRKLCFHNPDFRKHLGIGNDLPHFFHANSDIYIESINREICLTKWQGIPLLRYNLKDLGDLYSWSQVQETVKKYPFTQPNERILAGIVGAVPSQLPDLLVFYGRADSSINLLGTKIYEHVLDECIRSTNLMNLLTGLYKAKPSYHESYIYIDILVELKENVKSSPELLSKIEDLVEENLANINPEFRFDYDTVFKKRKEAIGLKVVKVRAVQWPELSSKTETEIKIRGVTPTDQ